MNTKCNLVNEENPNLVQALLLVRATRGLVGLAMDRFDPTVDHELPAIKL